MRKILLIIMLICSCSQDTFELLDCDTENNFNEWTQIEQDITILLNDYRVSLDLQEFIPDKQCKLAANHRVAYLITTGTISHDNLLAAIQQLLDCGYLSVYEMLGFGYTSAETVVQAWKNSEAHNEVIIKQDIKYIGVTVDIDAEGNMYYIIVLSKQRQ